MLPISKSPTGKENAGMARAVTGAHSTKMEADCQTFQTRYSSFLC